MESSSIKSAGRSDSISSEVNRAPGRLHSKPRQRDNLILAALPSAERTRLEPFLTRVNLDVETVLIHPNEPIKNMLFPIDLITSTVQEMSDGSIVETGLMGVEGMVGIQFWLHQQTTPTRSIIQVPGTGFLMSSDVFKREVMDKPSPLNPLVAACIHAFLTMTTQTAACNRLHEVEARLARWLCLVYNRLAQDEFPLRQEFLAQMLGVHRPAISIAAGALKERGLISYVRGLIKVEDPEGLRNASCECLKIIEDQYDKMYGRDWRPL